MYFQTVILLMNTCISIKSYNQKCPNKAHWTIRANWFCKEEQHYHCLFDANYRFFREICLDTDNLPGGLKSIFSGSRDAKQCSEERFSPTISWTNEGYQCIYKKSLCTEEGQIICNTGSSKEDVTCRCDHITGYSFVTEPKHKYFCSPRKEDCLCFKKICPSGYVLSKDYVCVRGEHTIVEPGCPTIFVPPRTQNDIKTDKAVPGSPSVLRGPTYERAIVSSVVMVVMIFLVLSILKLVFTNYERHRQSSAFSTSVLESSFYPRMKRTLDQKSLLILKGRKGTGKSTIGKVFQEKYSEDGYEIIHKTTSDYEILNMLEISSNKCFIFIDGICNPSNGNELFKAIIRIFNANKRTKIKIILTMKYLYSKSDVSFQYSGNVFNLSEILFDLDDKDFYSIKDREQILISHLTENNLCLNKPSENTGKQIKRFCFINEDLCNAICMTEPFFGFPWMCASFCQHEDHIKLGLQYFTQPPPLLLDDINTMIDDGSNTSIKAYQYCILVTVLLCEKNKFVIENIKTSPFQDLLKKFDRLNDISSDLHFVREAASGLTPVYLSGCGSEVTFSHYAVRSAVLVSCHKLYPRHVVEKCDVSEIVAYMKPDDYTPLHQEAVLFFEVNRKKDFSKRVADSILDKNEGKETFKTIIDRLTKYTEMEKESNFLLQVVEHLKNEEPGNYKARLTFFRSLGHFIGRNKSLVKDDIYAYNLSWEYISAKLELNGTYLDDIGKQLQNSDVEIQFLSQIVDRFKNTLIHYFIIWNGDKEYEIVSAFVDKFRKKSHYVTSREEEKLFRSQNSDNHSVLHLAAYLGRDRFFSILYQAIMLRKRNFKLTFTQKDIQSMADLVDKQVHMKIHRQELKISFEGCLIPKNSGVGVGDTKSFENIRMILDRTK